MHATLPGAKNAAMRSIAAEGVIVFAGDVDERTFLGIDGTDIRIRCIICADGSICQPGYLRQAVRMRYTP